MDTSTTSVTECRRRPVESFACTTRSQSPSSASIRGRRRQMWPVSESIANGLSSGRNCSLLFAWVSDCRWEAVVCVVGPLVCSAWSEKCTCRRFFGGLRTSRGEEDDLSDSVSGAEVELAPGDPILISYTKVPVVLLWGSRRTRVPLLAGSRNSKSGSSLRTSTCAQHICHSEVFQVNYCLSGFIMGTEVLNNWRAAPLIIAFMITIFIFRKSGI